LHNPAEPTFKLEEKMLGQLLKKFCQCRIALMPSALLVYLAALPNFSLADAQFKDSVPEFQSAHSLGMGGTAVSFSKGLDALFENPAGIAQSKFVLSDAVLASPMVTVGEEGKKLYSDIQKNTSTLELVQKYSNKPQHVSAQNVTGVAFKRAAIGFLQRGQVDLMAGSDPVSGVPTAELRANARAGVYLASARSFWEDNLMLGGTVKIVQKRELSLSKSVFEVEKDLKTQSAKSLLSENLTQGTGVGADIGAIYRIREMDTKPAFGLVLRNIGMSYDIGTPAEKAAPKPDPTTLDVGLSLEPGTRKSISRIAVDFTDALNKQKTSAFKRLHLGAELSYQNILGFMAGLGQGYPSFGAYLNLKILKIEAGFYGSEMGQQAGDLKSRRYFGRVSVGWLE
jgi:hypothetical protein